jgi:hypothetical protein
VPIRDHAELDALLIAAAEAPPETRIQYRDRIAEFGDSAVERLLAREWIGDQRYAGFAIRTIGRAGTLGATAASVALRGALANATSDVAERDIRDELDRLGIRKSPGASRKPGRSSTPKPKLAASISVEDLRIGRTYKRSELHDGGLGGSRQTGISYSANGSNALLFSDPSKASEWGYRDAPIGEDGYRFYGHWYGRGDMRMDRGNSVLRDRSPELFLFAEANGGFVYRGQFECLGWDWERTARDGREDQAIVFRLKLVR